MDPIYIGHFLIIPRKHKALFLDLSNEEIVAMSDLARKLFEIYKVLKNAEGFNLFTNSGVAAGQHVPHAHWHIFIRYEKEEIFPYDILNGKIKKKVMSMEEWTRVVEEIRELIDFSTGKGVYLKQ